MLADLNISAFTTLCCNVVAIWRYQLPSYLMSDSRSEPINFYNILVSDRHDLTLSIISYLLSDRRSDANTIHDSAKDRPQRTAKAKAFRDQRLLADAVRGVSLFFTRNGQYCTQKIVGGNFTLRSSHQKHRLSVVDWKQMSELQQQWVRHAVFSLSNAGVAGTHQSTSSLLLMSTWPTCTVQMLAIIIKVTCFLRKFQKRSIYTQQKAAEKLKIFGNFLLRK